MIAPTQSFVIWLDFSIACIDTVANVTVVIGVFDAALWQHCDAVVLCSGNREHRHAETTDRVLWHFCSFVIMITVSNLSECQGQLSPTYSAILTAADIFPQAFICCLYLGHFVIAASRFVPYYMPSVLEDFKLDNVPLALLAVFSLVVLILRWPAVHCAPRIPRVFHFVSRSSIIVSFFQVFSEYSFNKVTH